MLPWDPSSWFSSILPGTGPSFRGYTVGIIGRKGARELYNSFLVLSSGPSSWCVVGSVSLQPPDLTPPGVSTFPAFDRELHRAIPETYGVCNRKSMGRVIKPENQQFSSCQPGHPERINRETPEKGGSYEASRFKVYCRGEASGSRYGFFHPASSHYRCAGPGLNHGRVA